MKKVNEGYEGFAITPHPDAPRLSNRSDGKLHLMQLLSEIQSGRFNPNEEFVGLCREACLVSLYFYLKAIAAFDGPYDKLNKHLHLPMANWRQSAVCMQNGARAAGFMPRSHFKSTVWTHGAAGWEVIRNPNIRIRLTSSRTDKAEGFKNTVLSTFKNNELFGAILPKFVIKRSQADFVVPCRTKKFPEPNIKVGSTGGASAGDHHDLLLNDDLIDEQDIDANHMSTVEMERKKSWFKLSKESLLVDWVESRILVFGTRYALDDLYDDIWNDSRSIAGFHSDDFVAKDDGEWDLYYRVAVENGESIYPEAFPLEKYKKMAESEDPNVRWTYLTQYMNSPVDSGLTEFNNLNPVKSRLFKDDDGNMKIVRSMDARKHTVLRLKDMNVVAAVDPAFTEKGITAKTSKSALTIWAMDSDEWVYLLYAKVGYYDAHKFINHVFNGLDQFRGYCNRLILEKNAQQKMLEKPYNEEKRKRGTPIIIEMQGSTGDKDARIRNTVGVKLTQGKMGVVEGQGSEFVSELQSFPMAVYKKDTLDSSANCLENLKRPISGGEIEEIEELEEMQKYLLGNVDSYTGY